MHCPNCGSSKIRKNGKRRGKQNHFCVNCGRQFIDVYSPPKGYSESESRLKPTGFFTGRVIKLKLHYTVMRSAINSN